MRKLIIVGILLMGFVLAQDARQLQQNNAAMRTQIRANNLAVGFRMLLLKIDPSDTMVNPQGVTINTIEWGNSVLVGNAYPDLVRAVPLQGPTIEDAEKLKEEKQEKKKKKGKK